MNRKIF